MHNSTVVFKWTDSLPPFLQESKIEWALAVGKAGTSVGSSVVVFAGSCIGFEVENSGTIFVESFDGVDVGNSG